LRGEDLLNSAPNPADSTRPRLLDGVQDRQKPTQNAKRQGCAGAIRGLEHAISFEFSVMLVA